jgi:hypothetical protein
LSFATDGILWQFDFWKLSDVDDERIGAVLLTADRGSRVTESSFPERVLKINRPIGTEPFLDNTGCIRIEYGDRFDNVKFVSSENFYGPGDKYPAVDAMNAEVRICASETPRTIQTVFTALDGRGNKETFPGQIVIVDETVEGGAVGWTAVEEEKADSMGYGKYCSSDWCYQSDETTYDLGKPEVVVFVANPGETPTSVPIDTDTTFTVSTFGAGRVAFSLYFEGQRYRITNLPESCYGNPYECNERLEEFSNQEILQRAVHDGEIAISQDPLLPWFVDEVFIENSNARIRFATLDGLGGQ